MMHDVGIDLVEFEELKPRVDERFLARILSTHERRRYDSMRDESRRLAFLAGRFAAKEAYAKAARQFSSPLDFNQVTIYNDANGSPLLKSPHHQEAEVAISISHSSRAATAVCIIRKKECL